MANIESIASRIMLCTVNTSAWRATKFHKRETQDVQERHNSKAPKVLVTICEHKALTEIAKLDSAIYHAHRGLTLPSCQDGMRMLPASRQIEHSNKMREFADQRRAFVAQFVGDYDAIKAAAPVKLNGLFDESMWPSRKVVESKFGFASRYLACPTEGSWGEWLEESARTADEALRDQLREALERVRDRCKGDGKLFSSVFGNLAELVAMVPDLNLSDSRVIEEVADLAKPIGQIDAETVREDGKARAQIASQASRILTMLGGVK